MMGTQKKLSTAANAKKQGGSAARPKRGRQPTVAELMWIMNQEVLAELLAEAEVVAPQVPLEVNDKFCVQSARRLLTCLAAGAARVTAGRLAGVSETTLRNWMRWGKEERDGFKQLRALVRRAEELGAASLSTKVFDEASWRAAVWMLERKQPLRWGPPRLDLADFRQRLRKVEKECGVERNL